MINMSGNGAVLSDCGAYRWRLDRHIGAGPVVAMVCGVNPSTADASLDDQTVNKWRGFGRRLGWQRFMVGNVFGFRATDVKRLAGAGDPFGPGNNEHLREMMAEADILVPCWGRRDKVPRELRPHFDSLLAVMRGTGKPVMCWGLTADGDPRHPLMLAYDTPLAAYEES